MNGILVFGLNSIKIPNNVGKILYTGFKGNESITKVYIGKNINFIHPNAFNYCINLKLSKLINIIMYSIQMIKMMAFT